MSTLNTPPSFSVGQVVYSRQGHEAEYLTALPNGHHAVRPAMTYYSPDPDQGEYTSYEGVTEWGEVFLKPPVEKLNAEVAALNAQVNETRQTLQNIRAGITVAEREIAARKERIKQHEQLQLLDDYLAGRITHYVQRSYGWSDKCHGIRITSVKDEPCEAQRDDSWRKDKDLKLLCLFGDSKGDLTWRISRYSDGSGGSWTDVTPCTSLEEAQQIARVFYEEELVKWRTGEKDAWGWKSVIEQAKALGLEIPADAVATQKAVELATAEKAVEAARKALLIAEGELQARQMGMPVSAENVACAPLPA